MKTLSRVSLLLVVTISLTTCYKMKLKQKCCDDALRKQNVVDKDIAFMMPNIITPNDDSFNDRFMYSAYRPDKPSTDPDYQPSFAVKTFKIYKINGSKVLFQSNDYKSEFAGKGADGQNLPEGRYRYELTLDNNTFSGSLCILRTKSICTDMCRATDPEGDALLEVNACD